MSEEATLYAIPGSHRAKTGELMLQPRGFAPLRAHNASVVGAYLEHQGLAEAEERSGALLHERRALADPRLLSLVRDGNPIYAWPAEERHVWRSRHMPLAARVLEHVTRPSTQTCAFRV